jgi:hypothetical protein
MAPSDQYINELSRGALHSFADWPNPSVPTFGAGVYTVWHNDGRFIYVGMSGRGITAETVRRNTPQGLYTRVQSHASGRRSGEAVGRGERTSRRRISVYLAESRDTVVMAPQVPLVC